jgi:LysR family glycine cleavage system transcriptional activator
VAFGIAAQDILKGSLKQINCRSAPYGSGYRFLVNPRKETMPKVQRFRAWLVAEMIDMQRALERPA